MYCYHAVKRGGRDEKLRSCPRNYHRVLFTFQKLLSLDTKV